MLKRDYFLKALALDCFRYKQWVIEAFSLTRLKEGSEQRPYPMALTRDTSGHYFFVDDHGNRVILEDASTVDPPFAFKETISLKSGDLKNLKKNIDTTYGNVLFNQTVLVYPFGDKIDYMEGDVTVGRVEKIIEKRLIDDPLPDTYYDKHNLIKPTAKPGAIFVSEYQRYNEAIFSLAGFAQLCVPSASPKSMTTDPQIAVHRAELMEKYKGQLNDPVIQAKIGDELIAMDKAWIKGDVSEGFFFKNKSYDVVRKKMFIFQGNEAGFDTNSDLIQTSLSDGWDVANLPAMINALRDGSYNRGAMTALGGEATKFNYRIFQNTVISEEDCGSKNGLRTDIDEANKKHYISYSVISDNGLVELTEVNIDTYVGKSVLLRSPIYCKTEGANFCAVCIGKKIASTPHAISTYAADIGSRFMSLFLAAMHGKSLQVAKYDIAKCIR